MAKRFADCRSLEDLPNVGPAVAADLRAIGVTTPPALRGRDPFRLFEALNRRTGKRHDPCLLDTFIAIVRFADGGPPRPWWSYTAARKRTLAASTARAVNVRDGRNHRARGPFQATETIAKLRNLGPAATRRLAQAGIASVTALREQAAVEAFRRRQARVPGVSASLPWAREGALSDRAWQCVARGERMRIFLALDATPPRV